MSKKSERTKNNIKETFKSLIASHSIFDVSVTLICEELDINRSTFYEYFSSVDDLINELIIDSLDDVSSKNEVIYDAYYSTNNLTIENVKTYIINFINNIFLRRLIKSSKSDSYKTAIVKAQVEKELTNYNINERDRTISILYRNSGVLSIVFQLIEKKVDISIDDAVNCIYKELIKK